MAIRKFDEQQDIEAQRCAETPHGTPLITPLPAQGAFHQSCLKQASPPTQCLTSMIITSGLVIAIPRSRYANRLHQHNHCVASSYGSSEVPDDKHLARTITGMSGSPHNNGNAHGSVSNGAALDRKCNWLTLGCSDAADYKTDLRAFSFGSPGQLRSWLNTPPPGTRFQHIGFSRFSFRSPRQCHLPSDHSRCARD
jgi:hypothetical protein